MKSRSLGYSQETVCRRTVPLEVLANMGLAYMSAICFRSFRAMSTATKLRRWWGVAVVQLAHLHGQRMHTKPAMKRWFVAADETASQFGWTTAKVPPDARISDWMATVCHRRPHLAPCAPIFVLDSNVLQANLFTQSPCADKTRQ